ncbi:MAG: hypothetical protein N3G22_04905, partial [Candidatus Micrarchaeota archaeon]|nr:hypothetical protein [Candidatus Micrarchaeota archaeon]
MKNKKEGSEEPIFTAKNALSLVGAVAISILALALFSKVESLRSMGYIGVFLISLISSATVLFPLPGFAVVFAMGAFLNPVSYTHL